MEDIKIIDALGPFAIESEKPILNWSKLPFWNLESGHQLDKKKCKKILAAFEKYLKTIVDLGYNTISIDDLSHTVLFNFYNPSLKKLILEYQDLYKQLFTIASKLKIKIFVNTDYMFYNQEIDNFTKGNNELIEQFFYDCVEKSFQQYPEISGIILRIGESDAKDVRERFLSRLTLQTPQQANNLLKNVLRLFENYNKTLIFRTWTVGVNKIGDLIWNEKTYDTVFASIESNNLIIGMKYGDTDFLRYLSLNHLLFHGRHKKIIELQTKREWEGMGRFPSFVGWDYAEYLEKLRANKNLCGIHVWCQTGGWTWTPANSITYLQDSSFWNELNTYVTIKLYTDKKSVEELISDFCKLKRIKDIKSFIKLLKLSENVIKNGLYIKEFASKTIYFRRVRIPPLIWIAWDKIYITPLTKSFLLHEVKDTNQAIKEGNQAVEDLKQMLKLGKQIGLNTSVINSLKFELATFKILALIRKVIFFQLSGNEKKCIKKQISHYEKNYPEHYQTAINIWEQPTKSTRKADFAFNLVLRFRMAYRNLDRLILSTTPVQRFVVKQYIKKFVPFLSTQAMGIESIFK